MTDITSIDVRVNCADLTKAANEAERLADALERVASAKQSIELALEQGLNVALIMSEAAHD